MSLFIKNNKIQLYFEAFSEYEIDILFCIVKQYKKFPLDNKKFHFEEVIKIIQKYSKELDNSFENLKFQQTFTITFGDQAENHAGMHKIGKSVSEGFNLTDLKKTKEWFENENCKYEMIHLNELIEDVIDENIEIDDAYVLVIRKGLEAILFPHTANAFFFEQDNLEKDTKALMCGRVVNKQARYNLCFGNKADFEEGKGTVIPFNDVPLLKLTKDIKKIYFTN